MRSLELCIAVMLTEGAFIVLFLAVVGLWSLTRPARRLCGRSRPGHPLAREASMLRAFAPPASRTGKRGESRARFS